MRLLQWARKRNYKEKKSRLIKDGKTRGGDTMEK